VHDLAGDELGDGEPDDISDGVKVVDDAPHLAVVSPSGSAPRPSTSSLLSMVSTSKWMATREQPVAASQSSSGLGRLSQVVRAEGADAPLGHIGDVVVGPGVQPDQRDPVGG
jgi:hypothetical protein